MKDETMISVAVVEDDELIRDGLSSLLAYTPGFSLIASYEACEPLLENLETLAPDVILMDVGLPGINGIEGTRQVKKQRPQQDIIILTVQDNDDVVFEALCAGACGYLTKNVEPARLIESIRDVHNGGAPMSTAIARKVISSFQRNQQSPLTPRETEVLELLTKGKSYTMIADALYVDKETIRTHIKNIYRKLEVHSRAEAIEKALSQKLV